MQNDISTGPAIDERIQAMEAMLKSEHLRTNFLIFGLMAALDNRGRGAADEAAGKLKRAEVIGDVEREARDLAVQVLQQIARSLDNESPAPLQ